MTTGGPGTLRAAVSTSRTIRECPACGLVLEQVEGFDADVALGTFLQVHPAWPQALHRPDVPPGWSVVDPHEG